ncbi:MAG: DUF2085 domain-containing protein [Acidobacteria bacterium]|nr:DUF2085 domain-containing protein [Acidobacteriota bacterium]
MRSLLDLVTLPAALQAFGGCLVVAVTAAPLLAAQGRVEALVLYAAFSPFCHQSADRSWYLFGEPLAVCIRCLGIYCGAALGSIFLSGAASARNLPAAIAFCGGTWMLEVAGVCAIPAAVRLAAGATLGFAGMQFVAHVLAGREHARAGLLR